MKAAHLLLLLSIFSSMSHAGTPAAPTILTNGGLSNFTGNVGQDWFVFEVFKQGNVLFFGEGQSRPWLDRVTLYDTEYDGVASLGELSNRSLLMNPGVYYLSVTHREAGVISVYSPSLLNAPDIDAPLGSFGNPFVMLNGTTTATSRYLRVGYFETTSAGSVLIQPANPNGGTEYSFNVYNSDSLAREATSNPASVATIGFPKGGFYFVMRGASGASGTLASSVMANAPSLPQISRDFMAG